MPSYVAYTQGLGVTEDRPDGIASGDPISVADIGDDDEWNYHIQHGNIVRRGGPSDPAVLSASLGDDVPEDPKDLRIKQLEEQLELYSGRVATPAAGTHLSDLANHADDDEDNPDGPVADPKSEKVPASAASVDAAAGKPDAVK